jgi:molybdate transport system substrate-binding protein
VRWSTALLALVAALALAGCGGGDDRLTVYAAASLTDVFGEIDHDARYNFAGSDELATQIREGAEADVFAAASPRYPEELFAEHLVEKPRVFATNRLVLVVPRSNPARIESVADLARNGVKLVIGAEGVPVGDYTRKVLESLGQTDVLRNVVSEEEDVRSVLGKVAQAEADAGFVYATDVRAAGDDVRAIELPASAQARVEYEAAVVSSSTRADAARAFVNQLLGKDAQRILREAGFGPP